MKMSGEQVIEGRVLQVNIIDLLLNVRSQLLRYCAGTNGLGMKCANELS